MHEIVTTVNEDTAKLFLSYTSIKIYRTESLQITSKKIAENYGHLKLPTFIGMKS